MKNIDIKSILVVDDEEAMGKLVTAYLIISGYSCISTANALKALEMLEHYDFELVISDIEMSSMNGLDLTREIRNRHPGTDVIIMSGFGGAYTYSDIIEAGAVDFIGKPIGFPELKAKIARVNRERGMIAELRGANEHSLCSLTRMEAVNDKLLHEISEREKTEKELSRAHREIEALVSSIPLIMIEVSADGIIKRWNVLAEKEFQIEASEVIGKNICDCVIPWDGGRIKEALHDCISECLVMRLKAVQFTRKNGKEGLLEITISPIRDDASFFSSFIILGADITEQVLLERQLVQAQKLESIGQLAAGIAHEINTPTQYVGDNTRFLKDAFSNLEQINRLYENLLNRTKEHQPMDDLALEIENFKDKIDLGFLMEDIPNAINQSLDGISRISSIVRSMKEFSHPGSDEKIGVDLNKAIENTVTVARNEWKYVADVETHFDPDLPIVHCLPGEINQVILNVIINAAHAIGEQQRMKEEPRKGLIKIATRAVDGFVEISIADTGAGVPENIKMKIFDPFFTTKEVGRGTGQGLAISHSVIVDKHGGSISFESRAGKGAVFFIRLPLGY